MNSDNLTYFDSNKLKYTPRETKKFKFKKRITTRIYRIQTNGSIMCGYFCIGFINFMPKGIR